MEVQEPRDHGLPSIVQSNYCAHESPAGRILLIGGLIGGVMAATAEDGKRKVLQPSLAEFAFQWFHRVVALYCLLFGLMYWIRLVGFYEGADWRFDLMPVHWQIAASVLAVLFPFAASGLWMLASWGPVIWFLCALIEGTMYIGFPEFYGSRPSLVLSHVLVAMLYVGFRLVIYFQKRRAER